MLRGARKEVLEEALCSYLGHGQRTVVVRVWVTDSSLKRISD